MLVVERVLLVSPVSTGLWISLNQVMPQLFAIRKLGRLYQALDPPATRPRETRRVTHLPMDDSLDGVLTAQRRYPGDRRVDKTQ